ncbi:hypothetical protein B7494_g8230 [Chlorociboria aeruginascens]|nr:hypothetical protein B7494_g8230 [Chlorociboria aeruginascens]
MALDDVDAILARIDRQILDYKLLKEQRHVGPTMLGTLKKLQEAIMKVNESFGEESKRENVCADYEEALNIQSAPPKENNLRPSQSTQSHQHNQAMFQSLGLNSNGKRMDFEVTHRGREAKRRAPFKPSTKFLPIHTKAQTPQTTHTTIAAQSPSVTPTTAVRLGYANVVIKRSKDGDINTQTRIQSNEALETSALVDHPQSFLRKLVHVYSMSRAGRNQRLFDNEDAIKIPKFRYVHIFYSPSRKTPHHQVLKVSGAYVMRHARKIKAFLLAKCVQQLDDEHDEIIGEPYKSHGNNLVHVSLDHLVVTCASVQDPLAILIGQWDRDDVWDAMGTWCDSSPSYRPTTMKRLVTLMAVRLFLGCRRDHFEGLLNYTPEEDSEDGIWEDKLEEVQTIGLAMFPNTVRVNPHTTTSGFINPEVAEMSNMPQYAYFRDLMKEIPLVGIIKTDQGSAKTSGSTG